MEFIWIVFAFGCGLAARAIALPPLIGYLVAGFALNFLGFSASSNLEALSDLGITLMLFTIGLKLNVKDLMHLKVIGGALSHMTSWILLIAAFSFIPVGLGISYFAGMDWTQIALVAFALSFSSTVCVVKILEESGELKSRHSKLAIGILVIQDIVAVVFMACATGKLPEIWALGLLGLIFLRHPIGVVLEKVGHGELLPLMGFFLAFGGYELFNLVGVKGDLGALVVGFLLASHAKSNELYKSLMSFKDLFLIGFFLSIGFQALPSWEMVLLAAAISLFIPLKSVLFFGLLSGFKTRARTAFLSSLALSNYSEFGLIVIAVSVGAGWISTDWLVVLALAVSFSFVFTSVLYRRAHSIYRNKKAVITRFEPASLKANTRDVVPKGVEILVIGMGRVGKGAYNSLCHMTGSKVWGMDADEDRVAKLSKNNFNVFFGDGEDADLWLKMDLSQTKLVLIALPYMQDIKNIQEQLKTVVFSGKVVAFARYEDQIEQLSECGIDRIFNFYTEAGVGFAEESLALLNADTTYLDDDSNRLGKAQPSSA